MLLTNYDIDYVINVGSAGGLCLSQNVGDVVISNEVCQYDFDITAFKNRVLGEVPGLPPRIKADDALVNKAINVLLTKKLHHILKIILRMQNVVKWKRQQ